MKHLKFLAFILLALFIVFAGCRKKKCEQPEKPIPTSNSPVEYGSTITLSTTAVANATYSWIGPNGYKSSFQSPTIENANYSHEGDYSVTITIGECMSLPGTVKVSLKPLTTPCSPDKNTGTYASLPTQTYTTVNGGVNMVFNTYEATAATSLENMSIRFGTSGMPISGIYNIVNSAGTNIANNEVRITRTLTVMSMTTIFNAASGSLYVTKTGNSLSITFCDINFVTTNTTLNHSGSARIVID